MKRSPAQIEASRRNGARGGRRGDWHAVWWQAGYGDARVPASACRWTVLRWPTRAARDASVAAFVAAPGTALVPVPVRHPLVAAAKKSRSVVDYGVSVTPF